MCCGDAEVLDRNDDEVDHFTVVILNTGSGLIYPEII